MNEPEKNAASTHEACSLHEVDSRLHELERRMNEAHKRSEYAHWMNRSWNVVEQRLEEYADAKREYRAALESATDRISDPATR